MDFNQSVGYYTRECIVHFKEKVIKIVVFNRLTELIFIHLKSLTLTKAAFI